MAASTGRNRTSARGRWRQPGYTGLNFAIPIFFIGSILFANCAPTSPYRGPADPIVYLQTPAPRIQPIVGEAPSSAGHSREYSFLVGSHIYGSPYENQDDPALALAEAIDIVSKDSDRFFFSVGDMVYRGTDEHFDKVTGLLERTGLPTYNAPGNHDWTDPDLYRKRFGKSYGCMRYGTALFIVLNTDLDPWMIEDQQLEFFQRAMRFAIDEPFIQQVFIFAHRQIFTLRENFTGDLLPLLQEATQRKRVVWFASDIGRTKYYNPFCDTDPETGITYIGSAFFESPRDCMVRVRVAKSGELAFDIVSLAEPIPEKLEDLDMMYWKRRIDEDEKSKKK
ncbi:MAG: metallophosphoesterase family protein [Planctomycetota bacterium]